MSEDFKTDWQYFSFVTEVLRDLDVIAAFERQAAFESFEVFNKIQVPGVGYIFVGVVTEQKGMDTPFDLTRFVYGIEVNLVAVSDETFWTTETD